MSRTIKFRAWDKHMKRMSVDNNICLRDSGEIFMLRNLEYTSLPQNLFELMQYTGLLDKNGVEIYEGDIVKSCNQHIENVTAVVLWNVNTARFQLDTGSPMMNFIYTANIERMEVIGNIWEHKELLEGESNES